MNTNDTSVRKVVFSSVVLSHSRWLLTKALAAFKLHFKQPRFVLPSIVFQAHRREWQVLAYFCFDVIVVELFSSQRSLVPAGRH